MSLLARARYAAEQTPDSRNRAADFFRAVSILLVVSGHWFIFAPYVEQGAFRHARLLAAVPWTQYSTWAFQVMPVFFIVGGFANAASWASARRDPARRRAWQATRLRRLLLPTLPLVAFWSLAAAAARLTGAPAPELIRAASQAALIPIWFLAVYIMVTVAVPVSAALWRRFGIWSVIAPAMIAVAVDAIAFRAGAAWLRWSNYGFVWLAIHQLGYWWHARHLAGRRDRQSAIALLAIGVAALVLLVGPLGYPVSMVTVTRDEVSNSSPPTVAMLAMGGIQGGIILLAAAPVSRWLRDLRAWTAVILVNRMIMSVYLWHVTAMLALVGLALLLGGVGLGAVPGEAAWWLLRPAWFAAAGLTLAPVALLLAPLEAGARRGQAAPPGPVRAALGATLACAGLSWLALKGTGAENALGINWGPVLLVFLGVGLAAKATGRPGPA